MAASRTDGAAVSPPSASDDRSAEAVLRVRGLVKSFHRGLPPRRRRIEVLKGADLEVRTGELVGLVGENGSGKSTLMQIVVGLLNRDAGEVERPERVGYCPQVPMVWEKLTVHEHFELFAEAYGIEGDAAEQAEDSQLDELQFEHYRDFRIEELSGGTRQKLNLASAVVGVFVMQSALQGDRRLVVAGYRPGERVIARLIVLGAATSLVVTVAAVTTAFNFTPASWAPLLVALVLIGLIYALIGALAGAVLDRLAATYLMLFLVMVDVGVVQTPMFHETPGRFAWLLPSYGPSRVMYDGAFSEAFHAWGALVIGVGWLAALSAAVYIVLQRAVGQHV